ncbi:MAG: hypothetical protein GX484_06285, partial [Chloroflexi bacterium]|nr:hypothetical protein [Chloroflexota bacterium]
MIKLADDMMDVRFLGPTDEDDEEWLDDEELDDFEDWYDDEDWDDEDW